MTLPLSPSEFFVIKNLYKQTKDKKNANYLNLILLKHKKYTQVEIADILNLDENTVSTWIKKFEACDDVNQYLDHSYVPFVGKLSYTQLPKLIQFVLNNTCNDVKAVIEYVKANFSVVFSISGMTKLLNRLGFSYKRNVLLPSKLDTNKQADFVDQYDQIKASLTQNQAMFFMDGVHPQHNTHTQQAWSETGKPCYILSNSGRNRLNINGLYNPLSQEVITTFHKTINSQAVLKTFDELLTKHPDLDTIYIFADNARYYTSHVIKDYLALHPVIKLIHLPPYSPNLNLIERLWKYLRKTQIHNHYYETFQAFKTALESFFKTIEDHKDALAQFIGQKFHLFEIT